MRRSRRPGRPGRASRAGFAGVAAEVRSLAQRSATAAREFKSLISASSEKVAAGSGLVDDAGQTMQQIVASVARVAVLISFACLPVCPFARLPVA